MKKDDCVIAATMFSSKSTKASMAFTSRDDLLEKARLEREARRGEKTRNVSATIIQVLQVSLISGTGIERQHGSEHGSVC